MSHAPTRRLSTGGKQFKKARLHYVSEKVPSHDGTPCYTSWKRSVPDSAPGREPAPDSGSDSDPGPPRPRLSFQIYDTRPRSDDPDHLKALARKLHSETFMAGDRPMSPFDRIDVWGMPLAAEASDEERVARCKEHCLAEIASRGADTEFPISGLTTHEFWHRFIIIVDRPQDLWEEDGGFLVAYWDPIPEYAGKEPKAERHTYTELGELMGELKGEF